MTKAWKITSNTSFTKSVAHHNNPIVSFIRLGSPKLADVPLSKSEVLNKTLFSDMEKVFVNKLMTDC